LGEMQKKFSRNFQEYLYINYYMGTFEIILAVVASSAIIGTVVYMLLQKKVEKSKGDGSVIRMEDEVQGPPTSSMN